MLNEIQEEVAGGKPNWGRVLAQGWPEVSEQAAAWVEGEVDELADGVWPDLAGRSVVEAGEAWVRVAGRLGVAVPPGADPVAVMEGRAKVVLRAATAAAVAPGAVADAEVRVGAVAARAWVVEAARRYGAAAGPAAALYAELLELARPLLEGRGGWPGWPDHPAVPPAPAWPRVAAPLRWLRSAWLAATRGAFVPVPIGGPARPYVKRLTHAAAAGADPAWVALGVCAVLRFEGQGRLKDDRPLFHAILHELLSRVGFGPGADPEVLRRIGQRLIQPGSLRDRYTAGIRLPADSVHPLGALEQAFAMHWQGRVP